MLLGLDVSCAFPRLGGSGPAAAAKATVVAVKEGHVSKIASRFMNQQLETTSSERDVLFRRKTEPLSLMTKPNRGAIL